MTPLKKADDIMNLYKIGKETILVFWYEFKKNKLPL